SRGTAQQQQPEQCTPRRRPTSSRLAADRPNAAGHGHARPMGARGNRRRAGLGRRRRGAARAPYAAQVKLLLDTGVLGQICHRRKHAEVRAWFRRAVREHAFIVSELADYELRRELLRLGAAKMGPRFGRQRASGCTIAAKRRYVDSSRPPGSFLFLSAEHPGPQTVLSGAGAAVEAEAATVAVEMIEEAREDFTRAKRARPGRKITRKSERKTAGRRGA